MEEDMLVEAIEEGRIVKVPEFYAKSEGLPIIRKPSMVELQKKASNLVPGLQEKISQENKKPFSELLQNPKSWKKQQVTSELLDNFHWNIRIERKRRGISRKQFSKILNVSEENIKMIEAGFLPSNDFILINKIQQELGINVRKDKKDYTQSIGDMMKKTTIAEEGGWIPRKPKQEPKKETYNFSGNEIEILEDEI
jgi:ribosome-binding protein aMBF1 (putative translation factor)